MFRIEPHLIKTMVCVISVLFFFQVGFSSDSNLDSEILMVSFADGYEKDEIEYKVVSRDSCPFDIYDAGELCCDTMGCIPFDPGTIYESSPPRGGSGNYVYMWLRKVSYFDANGLLRYHDSEPIRLPNGDLYGGRDLDPGVHTVRTLYTRCVTTQECLDAGYGYFIETEYIEIDVKDCNCMPDDGGEIGDDQSTCFPFFDPAPLVSYNPATPADPTDPIRYRWYFSYEDTPFSTSTWNRIIGENDETIDPPLTDRDVYYYRLAFNPHCRDSFVLSNRVDIILGGDFTVIPNKEDVDCFGNNNGSITLATFDGNGPFTFEWSTSETTRTIDGLSPGTYDYTVTDVADCEKTGSVTITEPDELMITGNDVLLPCNGSLFGVVDIEVSGGVDPYTYIWNTGENTQDLIGKGAGTYCVTVTDANDCESEACYEIFEPDALDLDGDVTDVSCYDGDDGSISLTVSGGTTPYTYLWVPGGEMTSEITGLTAGQYCVTVTDQNNCRIEDCFEVEQPDEIIIDGDATDVSCYDGNDGSIDITVSGGTGNYTYEWSPDGQTTQDIDNLDAGQYCVTVTDENDCTAERCFDIEQPDEIEIDGDVNDVSCYDGNDGSINITVSGGTGTYDYQWADGPTSEDRTDLPEGTYCVTVTDENDCTAERCFDVEQPDELEIDGDVTDVTCYDDNDGEINITVSGGTGAYDYQWEDGPTSQNRTGLSEGTYCVTVTDENDCTAERCFDVEQPDEIIIDGDVNDVSCHDDNDGSIDITVSGGTGAYDYQWEDGPTTQDRTGLTEGTYCVTVTDENDCTAERCFEIEQPDPIVIQGSIWHVDCHDGNNGTITLFISGGTPTYEIDWQDPLTDGLDMQVDLVAGTYCVTVTDANDCTAERCFEVEQPDEIVIDGNVTDVSCYDGNDGSIDITVSGGTGVYEYEWSEGSTVQDLFSLTAGTYCVTVTDENDCTAERCFEVEQPDELEIDGDVTDVSCHDGNDGSIDVTVSGGTGPYDYEWQDGPTTADRNNLTEGTYCVTVTDQNDCSAERCFEIEQPDPIVIQGSIWHVDCHDGNNGTITLFISGGTPTYEIDWQDPLTDGLDMQVDLVAGTYCVTVTDANDCTAERCFEVEQAEEIVIDGDVTDVSCHDGNDGSIDITVSGGTGTYDYEWEDGTNTADRDNLTAGTYCVTVTDENDCTEERCFEVEQPDPIVIDGDVTDVSCYDGNDGSIDITVSGGTGTYDYEWEDGTNTADRDNLAAGTYCVTVTDENDCTAERCFEVEQPDELVIDGTVTDVSCHDGNDGSIDITVSGGTGAYDYEWEDGTNTADRDNLTAGTYCVTVTDENDCTAERCFEVEQPDPIVIDGDVTDVSCHDGNDGSIDITVSGGTGTYDYEWENGTNTPDRDNLTAGTYCVTVTDENDCTEERCFEVEQPDELVIDGDVTDVSCHDGNDGSIDITVSGGTGAYDYEWADGPTTADRDNLTAGTYCVTVTDENDCTAERCFEVEQPDPIEIDGDVTDVSCYDGDDGSIDITVSGGTGSYDYEWADGPTSADRNNLTAGTYCVTVTDENDCTAERCFEVEQPDELEIDGNITDVSCYGGDDGSIDVTVSGGTAPYNYQWADGPITADRDNLTAGTYCVTVTDDNDCTEARCFDVDQSDEIIIDGDVTDVSCHDGNDGSIDITVSGGTGSYDYAWADGPTSADRNNLVAGTYCVTVTDENDCTAERCFEVEQPDPIEIDGDVTDVSCYDGNDGSIDITVSGGTGSYDYEWADGPTSADRNNLVAGTYCVTVTDDNDCTAERCFEVEQPDELEIDGDVTDVSCHDGNDGSIDITVSGGTGSYDYEWADGPTSADRNNLVAGTYCVTVTDDNDCTVERCFEVEQPDELEIDGDVTDVSCHNGNDGSIDITVSGGTGSYDYEWADGPTSADRDNLVAGTYCVTVTDENDCTAERCFEVEQPDELEIDGDVTDVSCHDGNDGSIDITVSGGTGTYDYEWADGPTSADRNNLVAGTYCVTVTDDNDCTAERCFEVEQPDLIRITGDVTDVSCYDGNDGSIEITVSGGTGAYDYEWADGPTTADRDNLSAGTYCVTVTDENDCTAERCFDVEQPDELEIDGNVTDVSCHDGNDGSIDITVSGGTGSYDYEWVDGPITADRDNLTAGTYCVTVTDENDCTAERCFEVDQPRAIVIDGDVTDVSCHDGNDGSIDITVSGGTGSYDYEWADGLTSADRNNLVAGTYCVTVTDENDCTAERCFEVEQPDVIRITGDVTDVSCHDGNDGSIDITVSGGTGSYDYEWADGPITADRDNLTAGTYCVTVTDENDCTAERCFDVEQPDIIRITGDVTDVSCHDGNDGSIDITVSGGTGSYDYEWADGPTSEDRDNLSAGTYCVTVTDQNDCTAERCFEVEQPNAIVIDGDVTDVSCYGGDDGSIDITVSGGSGSYDYEWADGPTTEDRDNLSTGTYCVTVTDENDCTAERCFDVEQADEIIINGVVTDPTCHDVNDGSIDITISGGTGSYDYEWGDGPTTEDRNNLTEGTFCVTVTDENDCTAERCFEVEQPDLIRIRGDVTDVSCYGENDGSIDITVTGGTGSYDYEWGDGPTTADRSNLTAGTYCVTVTDENDCTAERCFDVEQPDRLTGDLDITDPTCNDDNGEARANVSGGTPPYNYEWSRNNTGAYWVDGLSAGPISVTVTDANDCEIVLNGELEEYDQLICNAKVIRMISTRNGSDGAIEAIVSGGESPYTYNWEYGGGMTADTRIVDNVSSGTYYLIVTDANGCRCISQVHVTNPAKVGNFVWEDLNGNGQQDLGEPGVEGVEVEISGTDIFGNSVMLSTTTDDTGMYMFDVKPGDYSIRFIKPNGTEFTDPGIGGEDVDSDADQGDGSTPSFTLTEGEYNPDIDAGIIETVNIGDYVWFDDNKDGIQDNDEDGVEDFVVRLVSAGPDGIFGTADDVIERTTMTDSDGYYLFTNVRPGTYRILFDPNSLPANTMFTLADVGGDDTDSDVLGVNGETISFDVVSGQDDDLSWDAGIKDNCRELQDGGIIGDDEMGCQAFFDPEPMTSTAPLGSDEYEFRWYRSFINIPFDVNSPEWRLIPGAVEESYDPSVVVYTTYYVRLARIKGCAVPFAASNRVTKETIGCDNECDNIVRAGVIGYSEANCGSFDPSEIVEVNPATGGSGSLEYLWIFTTDDPPSASSTWTPIPGSNSSSYDPSQVDQTTYFMRCVRREDCTKYVESNMVVKRVHDDPTANILNTETEYCVNDFTQLEASTDADIVSYEWNVPGSNEVNVSGSSAEVSWATAGTHTITLEVEDRFGCTAQDQLTVDVSNDPNECAGMLMAITIDANLVNDDEVQINYEASSVQNNVQFIVERSDDLGNSFVQINQFMEMTNSNTAFGITNDYSPSYGVNQYRITMINPFGTTVYSNIAEVVIQDDQDNGIFLSPNPIVGDHLILSSVNNLQEGTEYVVYNAEGKILISKIIGEETYRELIDTENWPEGMYFVKVKEPGMRPITIKALKFWR